MLGREGQSADSTVSTTHIKNSLLATSLFINVNIGNTSMGFKIQICNGLNLHGFNLYFQKKSGNNSSGLIRQSLLAKNPRNLKISTLSS